MSYSAAVHQSCTSGADAGPGCAGAPSILDQCVAEQAYVRDSMTRSLIYNQARAAFPPAPACHGCRTPCPEVAQGVCVPVQSSCLRSMQHDCTPTCTDVSCDPCSHKRSAGVHQRAGPRVRCAHRGLLPVLAGRPLDLHRLCSRAGVPALAVLPPDSSVHAGNMSPCKPSPLHKPATVEFCTPSASGEGLACAEHLLVHQAHV